MAIPVLLAGATIATRTMVPAVMRFFGGKAAQGSLTAAAATASNAAGITGGTAATVGAVASSSTLATAAAPAATGAAASAAGAAAGLGSKALGAAGGFTKGALRLAFMKPAGGIAPLKATFNAAWMAGAVNNATNGLAGEKVITPAAATVGKTVKDGLVSSGGMAKDALSGTAEKTGLDMPSLGMGAGGLMKAFNSNAMVGGLANKMSQNGIYAAIPAMMLMNAMNGGSPINRAFSAAAGGVMGLLLVKVLEAYGVKAPGISLGFNKAAGNDNGLVAAEHQNDMEAGQGEPVETALEAVGMETAQADLPQPQSRFNYQAPKLGM